MKKQVWGIGTLAMDVLMKVDTLPKEDGFCMVESTEHQPGGSGTNVMVQMARLGAACGYTGAVGDDKLGQCVLESLRQEKIDIEHMKIKPGKVTLHTEIVVDRTGAKFIMLNMGDAFGALKQEEIPQEEIESCEVYYTDLLPKEPALAGLIAAKKAGVTTAFNMQVGLETMDGLGFSKQEILDALAYVDIFAPCAEGLYALTGTQDLEACVQILRPYCKGIFLFTQGSKGSVAFDKSDRKITIPSKKIQVVDTTGAGDSYMGSFLFSYCLKKKGLKASMEFATTCAAYTCTGMGARFSPTWQEVEHELD